jgi:hypothetical protein
MTFGIVVADNSAQVVRRNSAQIVRRNIAQIMVADYFQQRIHMMKTSDLVLNFVLNPT